MGESPALMRRENHLVSFLPQQVLTDGKLALTVFFNYLMRKTHMIASYLWTYTECTVGEAETIFHVDIFYNLYIYSMPLNILRNIR